MATINVKWCSKCGAWKVVPGVFEWVKTETTTAGSGICTCVDTISQEEHERLLDESIHRYRHIWERMARI